MLHKYKSPSSQFFAPRADTHFSEKSEYKDSALRVSANKRRQRQKDGAQEELVLNRKWGHLVASYKNVQDELDFSAQKPN